MRYIWIIFAVLLVAMLALLPRLNQGRTSPAAEALPVRRASYSPAALAPARRADLARADSIVAFGLAQRGTPYVWAGTSPLTGFDCSGFIMYTFARFGVPVPHSTALLIDVGRPVARAEAQPGDIVVFTGTDPASTTPGHAGIVISRRGELPLRFVHASSSRREPFVKVSYIEETDYERRFMQVRRVLGPGTGVVTTARAKGSVAAPAGSGGTAAVVAALPVRAVAVAAAPAPVAPLPKILPKRLVVARKPIVKAVSARKAPAKLVAKAKTTRKAAAKPAAKVTAAHKSTAKPTAKKTIKTAPKLRATSPKKAVPQNKRATAR